MSRRVALCVAGVTFYVAYTYRSSVKRASARAFYQPSGEEGKN